MLVIPWQMVAALFGGVFFSTAAVALFPHEPIVMWAGQHLGVVATAAVATAGTLLACWFDYRILFPRVVPRLERWSSSSRALGSFTGTAMRLFQRRRFATLALSGLTPLPFLPFKIMAQLDNYPFRRYLLAIAVGRFPRYLLLASVGMVLPIPGWAVGALCLATVGAGLLYRRRVTRVTPAERASAA